MFDVKPNQSGFGGATSGGGMFGTPTAQTGIFGSTPQTQTPAAGSTGMFGANTGFGVQNKPAFAFGGGTSTSNSLFGQSQTQPTQTSSLFGQPTVQAAPATGGLFGSSFGGGGGFGSTASAATGTTIKFNPPAGTDSMVQSIYNIMYPFI